MKKQILNKEFCRMQKLAGLITENELNEAVEAKAWLVDEEDGVPKIFRFATVEDAKDEQFDEMADNPYNRPLFTSLEDLKSYLEAQYMRDYDIEKYRFVKNLNENLNENKYRASDFPEVTGFEEDNNRIIITFSDNTKDLIEPRNFANKEVGYSKFLELLNTMDTDPKAKQAVSDFLEIKRFNVISTSDINKLLADNGVDEKYYASMGGKEIEGGTETWIDIIEDIIGKPYDSGNISKKDDMKIQTFMNHLSRLGIEVV